MNELDVCELIKENYQKVKAAVNTRAFSYYIDKSDLLSAVNMKLANTIERRLFVGDNIEQFWGYINMLITNAAKDYKKSTRPTVDIDICTECHVVAQPDYEVRQFSKYVTLELIKKLSRNERVVFKNFFIDEMKYEEVAKEIERSVGYVKKMIFTIRKKANLFFGGKYKSLVA
jgi:RNA polymerase sigma factor (sigma-70 family)